MLAVRPVLQERPLAEFTGSWVPRVRPHATDLILPTWPREGRGFREGTTSMIGGAVAGGAHAPIGAGILVHIS